jgi:hypothetical protein
MDTSHHFGLKVLYIVPIYKSGSNIDPNNYRGICISSCLGKFFTLIMNERLNKYLDENNIMSNCQIGFREKIIGQPIIY